MRRLLAILGIVAVAFVAACNFDQITTSSVLVICVVDNDTLRVNPETGMIINTDLRCADMADSLSVVVP